MLLRKLDVYGFKSFADRTDFLFEPGLTAIVGPNGCGKSNVVDAIRWVLGEQSAKSLRGNEMLDVIFGGTANRKSLGYAEASLTIDNSLRRLSIDYDEVCVARRLYRSGESEYFLNKQPCRLKDIRELFMDTGIGMDAYSVIEQGKVDMLLQANAQDRRSIFEEAAGISKYKAKKRAALSKLQRVEQDLLRVQDILQEVQKQIRSIERQASKARRFKKLNDELRDRHLALLLHDFHQASAKLDSLQVELRDSTSRRDTLAATAERLDAELTQKETDAIELEQKLATLHASDAEAQARISSAEAAIAMNRDRIRELEAAEQRCRSEVGQAAARLAEIERDLETIAAQAAAAEHDIAGKQAQLDDKQGAAQQAGSRSAEMARLLEEQRGAVVDVLQRRSAVQNDLADAVNSQKALAHERQRIVSRSEAVHQELAELERRRGALAGTLEQLRQLLDADRAALERDRTDRADAEQRIAQMTDSIHELQVTLKSKESRHELLADLEARCEGLDAGVRAILEEARREGGSLHGVRGLVADLIDVELEHAPAIESVLGERVQAIVVNTTDDARAAMRFLRDQHGGRALFLPLDRVAHGRQKESDPATPVAAAPARAIVRPADGAAAVADALLSDAYVVGDLDAALDLARAGGGTLHTYVTPRGETARSDGFLFGGNGHERLGVISRRSELRALEAEMADLAAQINARKEERTLLGARAERLQQAVVKGEARITQSELTAARQADELERVESDAALRREELEVGRSEITDIDEQIEALRQREGALRGEIAELAEVETQAKQAISSVEDERDGLLQQKAVFDEEVTALKVALAQRRERCDSLRRAAQQFERSANEQRELVERKNAEIRQNAERRETAVEAIAQKEHELGALVEQRDALRSDTGRLEGERSALRQTLDAARGRTRELHAQLQKLDGQIQNCRVQSNEYEYALRSLEEKAQSECEACLAERHADYEDVEQDWDELRAAIDELTRKRDSIGPVNLLAIKELEELQQREQFLSDQFEDLSSGKQSLHEAIRKINHHSRKLFQETFDAVRANFQVLFRKLFGGGRADIFLEPDRDVLEAGIEIVARPPGKETRSISLLSGGEKVLTAVALLFAVFQAKPSPFCVLDEVDAALDEQNIDRFITMLREFLAHSQFIVISHSKRTMSLADALYGITMQEAGVSRKVSVKFTDANNGDHVAEETVEDEAVVVG